MHFKKGDLAIIVAGPWQEAIGKVVRILWKSRAYYGKGVACDGLDYWLDGGEPIYVVRLESGSTLPAGPTPGQVQHRLNRRPYCGCWMRPLVRKELVEQTDQAIKVPQKQKELETV